MYIIACHICHVWMMVSSAWLGKDHHAYCIDHKPESAEPMKSIAISYEPEGDDAR